MLLNFTPDDISREQYLFVPSVVPTPSEIEAIPHNHMHAGPIGGQLNLHVDHEDIDGVKGFSGSKRVNYSKDWNLRIFVTS